MNSNFTLLQRRQRLESALRALFDPARTPVRWTFPVGMARRNRQSQQYLIFQQCNHIQFRIGHDHVVRIVLLAKFGNIALIRDQLEIGRKVERKSQCAQTTLTSQLQYTFYIAAQKRLAFFADASGQGIFNRAFGGIKTVLQPAEICDRHSTMQRLAIARKLKTVDHDLFRHKARMI